MGSSAVSIDRAAFPLAPPRAVSWPRRAFKGLSWNVVALFAALSAVWTLSMTFHDFAGGFEKGELLPYLVFVTGGTIASSMLTALLMGLPILATSNLGPQHGWRRVAALALCIVAVAPIGVGIRFAYLWLITGGEPSPMSLGERLIVFWFRYGVQAALLTVMAEFHRLELRNVQAMRAAEIDRLALDREMAEARLQLMQAQIEPHFLFNTLANVRRLYQTDVATGSRMMDNVMRYLEVALPPMMLLTLVENAIKHGLNPLPEGGRIVISAQRDGDHLRLEVRDDGRGFRESSGAGTGLANIRARLALLHAESATLLLTENAERGVTSTLVLPATRALEEATA
jgi:two-component sensor histidine kinase